MPFSQLATAHQVEISNEVGGTLHIEPDDTPRAGEEVLAWVALTRRGGETIQLAECDCQMTVYTQPRQPSSEPILSPSLSAVASEGYQGIPGANLTFPTVGLYTIAVSGSPKQSDDFSPFELAFDVTVAAGASPSESPADSAAAPPQDSSEAASGGSALDDVSTSDTAVSDATAPPDAVASDNVSDAGQRPLLILLLGGVVIGAISFLVLRKR
ncbi:hypothetical protein S7335_4263 [Synechococcus sp. PCC 7335]|uniref:hypothetical protein n=1 Tax=Synechococcus sp. (strain ATCC 29403 / PCC 7335) TaxID=91464 RepID=UPI00017ED1FC|nr:hypothetical protein [Synechococcus sp. PCC 7335]EDX86558.1 hypothetical protein S7335_4263 [Synechococcus sp. PCC 7335]